MRNRFLCLIPTTANLQLRMKFKLFNCERERERASKRESCCGCRSETRSQDAQQLIKAWRVWSIHTQQSGGDFLYASHLKTLQFIRKVFVSTPEFLFVCVLNCVCRTSVCVWTTVWVHHSGPHTQSHHVLFSEYTPVNTNISIIIHIIYVGG